MGWVQFPSNSYYDENNHYDVVKWKHFPRYWPYVRGIHRSPVNSLHKGQWRGALTFSLICAWINCCVNNREAGYLRRHCAHYDVTAMVNEMIPVLIEPHKFYLKCSLESIKKYVYINQGRYFGPKTWIRSSISSRVQVQMKRSRQLKQ